MENYEKINFYQERTMGERISAATEFVKQSAKIIWKHVLIVALPLIILSVYMSSQINMSALMEQAMQGDLDVLGTEYQKLLYVSLATALVQSVMMCLIYGMVATMMNLYDAGKLDSSLGTLTIIQKSLPLILKTFLIGLVAMLIFLVVLMLLAMLSIAVPVVGALLMLAGIIAIIPLFFTIFFPAYFQGAGVLESIKEGTKIGFKNWISFVGVILILFMLAFFASMVFTIPASTLMLSPNASHTGILLLSLLQTIISTLLIPLYIIYPAFQYFSVVEREEGFTIQTEIDEFDKL